jgi:quinol monooxygenase YgiN
MAQLEVDMSFMQIIKYHTNRPDEVMRLADEMEASGGPHAYTYLAATKDLDNSDTYYTVVEFPSQEVAMKNNDDPQTQDFAAKMMQLCDGPPEFINLDVRRKM